VLPRVVAGYSKIRFDASFFLLMMTVFVFFYSSVSSQNAISSGKMGFDALFIPVLLYFSVQDSVETEVDYFVAIKIIVLSVSSNWSCDIIHVCHCPDLLWTKLEKNILEHCLGIVPNGSVFYLFAGLPIATAFFLFVICSVQEKICNKDYNGLFDRIFDWHGVIGSYS